MLKQPTVAKEISDFQSALDFVCDLRNAGSKFSLDRIAKFAEAFGNPHLKYPVIHVAGTNGKGSVCAMLERILRAHGLKTGMFTSPHLVNLGERVQINREELSRAEILRRIQALRKVADGIFNPSETPPCHRRPVGQFPPQSVHRWATPRCARTPPVPPAFDSTDSRTHHPPPHPRRRWLRR